MWKTRWENTNHSLLQMVEERTQNQGTITNLKTKVDRLEKLCRALQTERKTLRSQLQGDDEDNTVAVTTTTASPEPPLVAERDIGESDNELVTNSTVPSDEKSSPCTSVSVVEVGPGKVSVENDELPEADKEMSHLSVNESENVENGDTQC